MGRDTIIYIYIYTHTYYKITTFNPLSHHYFPELIFVADVIFT